MHIYTLNYILPVSLTEQTVSNPGSLLTTK